MPQSLAALQRLESLRLEFGPQLARKKLPYLQDLKTEELKSVGQIIRLHEVLCFMQAWPDSAEVLSRVDELLSRFQRRRDSKRYAEQLADTGIAGAPVSFSFYAATAAWLADRWPSQLQIDWEAFNNVAALEPYLDLLATYSETTALDNVPMELSDGINRLKAPAETDANFVVKRLQKLATDDFLFERLYEEFDIPLILVPGSDTPSRTHAKYGRAPIVYQTTPLDRRRPAVADECQRPPGPPKLLGRAAGSRLIDVARSAMVTRHRDLDAFAYADANDVSLIDDDGGLHFVLYGLLPQRRFVLETQYGYLILKNGVPISYGAITCLYNSAEVAYTVFDTFRGGDSARIYVRTLVMVSHIFGCDTFMIDPYQLGEDNEDALHSGAWWFYQKLGYRPRGKKLLRLMNQELSKIRRQPHHRSSMTVLKQLASENVYLSLNSQREDVLGVLNLPNAGLKIVDLMANRFGSEREQGEVTLAAEAAQRLRVESFPDWSRAERLAWRRWAPLVALLKSVERWPLADRRALVQVIRAKGGRRELEYLQRFDEHRRLRAGVAEVSA
jgi:hypothetical protein